MDEKELIDAFLNKMLQSKIDIPVVLSAPQATLLVQCLQSISTQAADHQGMREFAKSLGRRLQGDLTAHFPEAHEILESGWETASHTNGDSHL